MIEILCESPDKGYLVARVDAGGKFETLDAMGRMMADKGFVKESYIEAVKEREKVFPTGLPMEALGVALPHTDSIHVEKKAIMCGILDEPVDFVIMGDDEATVSVEIIFMLAILSPDDQVETLSRLVELCQDVSVLKTIKEASDIEFIESVMDGLMA